MVPRDQQDLKAISARPDRKAIWARQGRLAQWLRDDKQKRFALAALVAKQAAGLPLPTNDYLFVEPAVYEYKALEEYAISIYWAGNKEAAKEAYEKLLTRVPDWYAPHIKQMLAMCERDLR